MALRKSHKDARQILFLQACVALYTVFDMTAAYATDQYLTLKIGLLEALAEPLPEFGWMVTEAVFGSFLGTLT